jgi:hypothetical protein
VCCVLPREPLAWVSLTITRWPLRDHSRERNLDLHHPRGRHHTSSSSTRETQDRRPDWMTSRSTDRSSPASRIGEPTENQVPPMTSDLPIRRAGLIAANESIGAMYQVAPPTPSDGSSLPIESCAHVASRPSDTERSPTVVHRGASSPSGQHHRAAAARPIRSGVPRARRRRRRARRGRRLRRWRGARRHRCGRRAARSGDARSRGCRP